MIETKINPKGIATLVLDAPNASVNVINSAFMDVFEAEIERLLHNDKVRGIVLRSGKKDFMVGADLKEIAVLKTAEEISALASRLHAAFRKIETSEKPVVAGMIGMTFGGGYELCLACHYLIALDDPKTSIGLPEVSLGLLPGGGGTQRLPRMIGFQNALPYLLEGRKANAAEALKVGMVDELASSPEDMVEKALAWIMHHPKPVKPWDEKGFKVPGGEVNSMTGMQVFSATAGLILQKTYHNYPAPLAIMNAVYEGLQLPFDQAIEVEVKYFVECALSQVSRNMIRSLFFNLNAAKAGIARPKDIPRKAVRKVGVLGAGMMGAGIAYVTAGAGIPVLLKDVSVGAAEKGKDYSRKLLDKRIERGRSTRAKADALLELITSTGSADDLSGCDLIIEAVFEDRALKSRVTQEAETAMDPEGVFASNTSTLPISGLAQASERPGSFIGLHFFSPVDKMQLVEVILGKETSEAALAFALDYVLKIRKIPIVVNDSPGFYTSRVFKTFVMEGVEMLKEGVTPALIENGAKMAGMPVGPLAVADEVSIELLYRIMKQNEQDGRVEKGARREVVHLFIEQLDRPGKKAGKGFYDYPQGGKKRLWPGLKEHFPPLEQQPDVEIVKQRILYAQALETARCLEEGVIRQPADADLGSIFGWGFPAWTGGAISFIDMVGVGEFVKGCEALADQYGERFQPTKRLKAMAESGKAFY